MPMKVWEHLRIPFEKIEVATENFKTCIGRGGYGRVYKGVLSINGNYTNVAVKRLNEQFGQGLKEFLAEILVLSGQEHPNLISLVGYCDEGKEKIIVYEYAERGSLDRYIKRKNGDATSTSLTWLERLKICADAARGLDHLHNHVGEHAAIIHRDIKSSNIWIDENWVAKIGDFGLSKLSGAGFGMSFIVSNGCGTRGYCEPEYYTTGILTKKSDVYSFGIVLFEVLCGRLCLVDDDDDGFILSGISAKEYFKNGKLDKIIDPSLKEHIGSYYLNKFATIAYRCLNDDREQRPGMDVVKNELEEILKFQVAVDVEHELPHMRDIKVDIRVDNREEKLFKMREVLSSQPLSPRSSGSNVYHKEKGMKKWQHLKIPFRDIEIATKKFKNSIGRGGFGMVYQGELSRQGKPIKVAAKRLNEQFGQGLKEFWTEIQILSGQEHPNLISLVGYCDEGKEKIIVYEYAERGSLDRYIKRKNRDATSTSLTWLERLKICADAARGLDHLHNHVGEHAAIIHRDIKSSNIWIDENWVAKIGDFGLSKLSGAGFGMSFIVSNACGTRGYCEPEYYTTGILTKKSDVYSFGIVLFEVLCGRLCIIDSDDDDGFILSGISAKEYFKNGKLDKIIDPSLKEHIGSYYLNKFATIAYRCLNDDREQRPGMDAVKNELEEMLKFQIRISHAEFPHLQIPFLDIVTATSNFAAEKLIKEVKFGKDYEGQMWLSGQLTDIVARKLDVIYGQEVEFLGVVSIYSSLKHKNIAFFIGFCSENSEKIIIYKHAAHGSLDQHLADATLTWFQRLQICLGVARALSQIHYDVIHCDINSSNIFLDEDWEAKLFGFELSTKYPESWRHRLVFSRYFDTSDYIDPVYLENATVTPKYDVYSFGIVLFEVLCGRKAMIGKGGIDQSLAAMAKCHYDEGKLDAIIVEGLRRQMDLESLTIFSNTAYHCLTERVKRPTMDQVVRDLEEALEHQWKRENNEHAADADDGISSNRLKKEKLECLRIRLSDIKLATDSFDKKYCIGSGGYGMVYGADLEHLDLERFSSEMQGNNKLELPKRRSKVAIKQILNRSDEQGKQGFLAEIELLTSCKHQNIVSLLGFSREDREMILVYEFLVNGSLAEYFESKDKKTNLTWNQRIQICLNIAEGLQYLHTSIEGKPRIIHRDIKSANVLLDENWNAKIADFGLSKFHPANQLASTIQTKAVVGTEVYIDPEYPTTGKYKKESDIYSFGVVMFEILSGTLAYDFVYLNEEDKGLAPIARRRFSEGTLKEWIDPTMMVEDDEKRFTLNRGPNQDSFDAFTRIAHQCLAETQAKRPPMEVVIKELHNALSLQGETMVLFRVRLKDIVQATETFKETYRIRFDAYGIVYKAELDQFESRSSSLIEEKNKGEQPNERISVAIKRISCREDGQGKQGFFEEIEMCTRYKHPNIVSLFGFCDEGHEMIFVYEHASNRSLNDYLVRYDNKNMLTWVQRLRKCLEIASGLNHLHTKMGSKPRIIHGDIRSANILFDKNFVAKIAYFGISLLHPANQEASTKVYLDPEYETTGKLGIESDVYSFGVVLFEILCGRLAYDQIYTGSDKGLASMARQCCDDGTIKKMIDHKLLEETKEDDSTANKGPNPDSLDTFLKVAYQCLEETHTTRPTMETVIAELKKAINYQESLMKDIQISLENIKMATQEFSQQNCVASGRDWKVYRGEVSDANAIERTAIVAKRWIRRFSRVNYQFRTELDILFNRKHENIIGLAGYCNESDETIIVYKHAWNGRLDEHLNNVKLTWIKRLQICINVASGLEFLHGGDVTSKKLVHGNIKSASILLTSDWKAKISNLEFSSLGSIHQHIEHVSDNSYGTFGYLDPEYAKSDILTDKSDIYSLGVILFEILCGRLAWEEGCEDHSQSLGPLAKRRYEEGKLDEMVFKGIKQQIVPQSLVTFSNVAYQCLGVDGDKRPEASEVVIQLKEALASQEDKEIWEPILPSNYKEIIDKSEKPGIYSNTKKQDLYRMLSEGIFLLDRKVWFSLSKDGKANKMISATMFSYENPTAHKWGSIPESRFPRVAKMTDITNLKIRIEIKAEILSMDTVYGVHLVFKFCDPGKVSSNPMYVNLKYKTGSETSHAYFAKHRDNDGWMMIELYRFLNQKKVTDFEVLLERFSPYDCGNGAIYVQGIEFQAIENMKHEEIEILKGTQQVQKSDVNKDQKQQMPKNHGETFMGSEHNYDEIKIFQQSEVDGKKHLTISTTEVLFNSTEMKPFHLKPSAESRFQNVLELLPQQVFRIKYMIESEKLSPFTEYACYIVFKLSEECHELHCPVKVRDLHQKTKETKHLYFRSPALFNQHDASVPNQRKDGWMEVMVWKFNSKYKLANNLIPMNLKLVAYEGTMSGLIICGLDFRPM